MKKGTIAIIVIAVVVVLAGIVAKSYNGMVTKRENVKTAWSNVETQYQRRNDLIPNLVNTVKGYASYESSTLEGVVEARAKATQLTVNADDLDEESIEKYQAAQGEVSSALGRLLAITESYPELKADQSFIGLQDELAGTENRINNARKEFNEVANDYNITIQKFPANIVAGMFGFKTTAQFKADEGAEKAPVVEF